MSCRKTVNTIIFKVPEWTNQMSDLCIKSGNIVYLYNLSNHSKVEANLLSALKNIYTITPG